MDQTNVEAAGEEALGLTQLLSFTLKEGASDLHLNSGNPPIIRVSNQLKRVKRPGLTSDEIRTMLYSVMTEEQRSIYEKNLELDFAISLGEKARFRVNAFTTRVGAACVFRVIPSSIPTMEELDLPPVMRRFAQLDKGIVLATGPTGSGKSTTLAAIIDYINTNMSKHILTIEDPVEFFHSPKKGLISHREVGEDTHGFKEALKSALREDPDVIMVGEMRDYETISLALTAAETGHLVFGTLHSNSAAKTIDRIIEVFPPGDKEMVRSMLSSSLQGVISQTLVRRADGGGRIAAFEILVGTNAVRNLIRENNLAQIFSMMQTGSRFGMSTMDDAVKNLEKAGIITSEEAQKTLLKVVDEDDGLQDSAYVSGALGGGVQLSPGTSMSMSPDVQVGGASGDDDDDQGMTF